MGDLGERFRARFALLAVLGPTASGKTDLAVALARALGGEILSADSRQVYRGMDLGTGKDLALYREGGEAVPYHLIDLVPPDQEFNLFDYQRHFARAYREVVARGRTPVLAGGTGLYLDAVLRGYRMAAVPVNEQLREALVQEDMAGLKRRLAALSPRLHNTTDLLERERLVRAIEIAAYTPQERPLPPLPESKAKLVFGIRIERQALRERIALRLARRMEEGLVEEVARLRREGILWKRLDALGLEYRYVALYLRGALGREEMQAALLTRIHQYAKRQETWFRGMERKGVTIHWLDGCLPEEALSCIEGWV